MKISKLGLTLKIIPMNCPKEIIQEIIAKFSSPKYIPKISHLSTNKVEDVKILVLSISD